MNYDDIYFELSNSSTIQGRFPNDDEFMEKIKTELSNDYARVLLLKMEENETKNIPVDICEVSIEHIMPQTLTEEWKNYLGGYESSDEIHTKYLQCIGNLTPVSKSYNSKMSNKLYNEKIKSLEEVQFSITNSIPKKHLNWQEEDINKRNEKMSKLAVKSTTSPLERSRPIR
ncbi:HNH endonuclease family protein, partial [Erysipelotrichaceae bacterium OttesenSCG-928-M19]|nr:HNH endonuclease family protein [Erysipelotrichaceae bacterium OttesenSCG-928-M19]